VVGERLCQMRMRSISTVLNRINTLDVSLGFACSGRRTQTKRLSTFSKLREPHLHFSTTFSLPYQDLKNFPFDFATRGKLSRLAVIHAEAA
jgi:hypothetical protein